MTHFRNLFLALSYVRRYVCGNLRLLLTGFKLFDQSTTLPWPQFPFATLTYFNLLFLSYLDKDFEIILFDHCFIFLFLLIRKTFLLLLFNWGWCGGHCYILLQQPNLTIFADRQTDKLMAWGINEGGVSVPNYKEIMENNLTKYLFFLCGGEGGIDDSQMCWGG